MAVDKVILGENAIYSTDSNETGLNNNILVCGGSGCGKTMSISEPRLLETLNSSLVATVTKRRLVSKYAALFRERGYDVLDLNFINPSDSNVAYDPLEYIDSHADITFLAASIVSSNPRKEKSTADPYWEEAATSLLSAEIAYTLATKDNPTFADVLELHDSIEFNEGIGPIETSLDSKFKAIAKKEPTNFAVSCWKSFRQLPFKTAACVFGTLNTTIDSIFTPELRKMMAMEKKVDFEKLSSTKTILFVSTSAVNPTLHCFVNMFYSIMFKELFEFAESRKEGTLPIPVHVLCDDFATGSRIFNFPEYISVFREKLISVTLLLQSESQLESIYGQDAATTIINNCDTYVFMGCMDLKTGRSISERINMPLDEVLYMPLGKEVILRRGQRPILTQRYNILKNEPYKKITKLYERELNDNKHCLQFEDVK